jgi:hypothetical protein
MSKLKAQTATPCPPMASRAARVVLPVLLASTMASCIAPSARVDEDLDSSGESSSSQTTSDGATSGQGGGGGSGSGSGSGGAATTGPGGGATSVSTGMGQGGAGGGPSCNNGDKRCSPDASNTPQSCSDGAWSDDSPCETPRICWMGSCEEPVLLSSNKTAEQSTLYEIADVYPASAAVDGDLNTFQHNASVAEAGWWMVDLGSVRELSRVDVYSRPGYEIRVSNFDIRVSNDGSDWTVLATELGSAAHPTTYPVVGAGRFVRIERRVEFPATQPLNIAEVEVFGF